MDMDMRNKHSYLFHNPFTNTTLPLPELDAVIGNVSELFAVHRVRMRTTPFDVIAVMTNNWNYPIILIRPGKGVWLPKPQSAPFIYIIDIAFLGQKLYGITQAEDLVSLDIDFDSSGIPPLQLSSASSRTRREIIGSVCGAAPMTIPTPQTKIRAIRKMLPIMRSKTRLINFVRQLAMT
jgi:hypothetical protein